MPQELDRAFAALRDTFIESRFDRLNPVQRQAVFCTEGPLLLLAAAETMFFGAAEGVILRERRKRQ